MSARDARTVAAELLALAEKATRGPWQVERTPNPLNELGNATFPGGVVMDDEPCVVTAWNHPQVHGPMPILGVGVSPYRERAHALWMHNNDAEYIAAANPESIALVCRALLEGAQPNQFWLASDPECAYGDAVDEFMEFVDVNEVAKVLTARTLPPMWVANVATEYSDDFENVEESEMRLFANEEEARHAVAVDPRPTTEDTAMHSAAAKKAGTN